MNYVLSVTLRFHHAQGLSKSQMDYLCCQPIDRTQTCREPRNAVTPEEGYGSSVEPRLTIRRPEAS
ncbi:hypothetical protein THTE_2292 [Thermogutta terrifontis]|uniref:Uncharacterized protein n=1 Tax=Thermogutta terrifontis TaxID=1331910 RepID=A0A286RG18_9BACT|nr:hypothetical protein THTE_2292 [Thermogutta terrifontis]